MEIPLDPEVRGVDWYWLEDIRCLTLTPTEAVVSITVMTQDLLGGEVVGRLVGPRCEYSTTIEVAYRLQPQALQPDQPTRLTAHVLIPEPCSWEPETPFIYQGNVEAVLNRTCEQAFPVTVGLRTVRWRGDELRVNGQPFFLHAVRCANLSSDMGRQLRADGVNCLLVPVAAATASVWDAADRLGFFVVGEIVEHDYASFSRARGLRLHPCHLGWLPTAGVRPADFPHWPEDWRDPALFATIRDLSSE